MAILHVENFWKYFKHYVSSITVALGIGFVAGYYYGSSRVSEKNTLEEQPSVINQHIYLDDKVVDYLKKMNDRSDLEYKLYEK